MIEVVRNPTQAVPSGRLRLLYAELPTVRCQQQCQEYCRNITMSGVEFDLIREELGYTPHSDPANPEPCPLLDSCGDCFVYRLRPMICRLWGITETMQCPWGCEPTPRYLREEEAFAYLIRTGLFGRRLSQREAEEVAVRALERR